MKKFINGVSGLILVLFFFGLSLYYTIQTYIGWMITDKDIVIFLRDFICFIVFGSGTLWLWSTFRVGAMILSLVDKIVRSK